MPILPSAPGLGGLSLVKSQKSQKDRDNCLGDSAIALIRNPPEHIPTPSVRGLHLLSLGQQGGLVCMKSKNIPKREAAHIGEALGEVGNSGGAGFGGSGAEIGGLEHPCDGRLVSDDAGVGRAVPEVAADVERRRLRAAAPRAVERALVLHMMQRVH